MAQKTYPMIAKYVEMMDTADGETQVEAQFVADLPDDLQLTDHAGGADIFTALAKEYEGEELAEIAAELVLALTAGCSADDFHNWNYDHLSTIIELSNRFGYRIPRNLVNGLPEQLIILVDHTNLGQPSCD
ncbi:MAG: hypothetical protein PF508_05860 [Spirochaeta sp.]|nr:hypothetical protein [Spirochaeta sp.]